MPHRSLHDILIRKLLPEKYYRWLVRRRQWRSTWAPSAWANPASPSRLQPISREFGCDRGMCIDRYYIESFLKRHSGDIRGRVLEVGDPRYTKRFGAGNVTQSDVLHAAPGNTFATITGDLASGAGIPKAAYDCIILTQVLHCIYDIHAAVATGFECLKPGGVLLASIPCISQISRWDMDRWGDCWRMTSFSVRRLFESVFPPDCLDVHACGNVYVASAFLYGLSADELNKEELDYNDPDYELVITVRSQKPKQP